MSKVTPVTRYQSLFANSAGLLHLHMLDTSASLLLSLPCNYVTSGLPLLLPYIYACTVTPNDTLKAKQAYAFVRLRTEYHVPTYPICKPVCTVHVAGSEAIALLNSTTATSDECDHNL